MKPASPGIRRELAVVTVCVFSAFCGRNPEMVPPTDNTHQGAPSAESADVRNEAGQLIALGHGVRAVAMLGFLGRARNLSGADRALYTKALSAAGAELAAAGRIREAQSYWAEWAELEPDNEEPRAMIAATSEKGQPFIAPPRSIVVIAEAPLPAAEKPAVPAVTEAQRGKEAQLSEGEPSPQEPSAQEPVSAAIEPPQETPPPDPSVARSDTRATPAQTVQLTLDQIAELIRKGRFELAEAVTRRYLLNREASPTALNLLGITLMQQGKRQDAVNAFKESLKLKPNQPEVKMAIDDLENALQDE